MGVSTFSTGILVWKQSLRKCELYEADWHFKHRQSYCLSQTAHPLYVCSGLCFLFQQNVCIIKKIHITSVAPPVGSAHISLM